MKSKLILIFGSILFSNYTYSAEYLKKLFQKNKEVQSIQINGNKGYQSSKIFRRPGGYFVEYELFDEKNNKLSSFRIFLDNEQTYMYTSDVKITSLGNKYSDAVKRWINQIQNQYKQLAELVQKENQKRMVKIGNFEGSELKKITFRPEQNIIDYLSYELFDQQDRLLAIVKVFLDKDQKVLGLEASINFRDIGTFKPVVDEWIKQIKDSHPKEHF